MTAPTVFISYSSRDRDAATYIAEKLKSVGSEVFIDHQRLSAGDNFIKTIGVEIDRSQFLVVLLSPNSLQSKWVRAEVSYAFKKDKAIIPVLLDSDIEISGDFFFLNNLHFVNFTGWPASEELADQIDDLLSVVTRQASDPASETSVPGKPRELSNLETLFYGAIVLETALNQWTQWKNSRIRAKDYELSGTLPPPLAPVSVPRSPKAITAENAGNLKQIGSLDAHFGAIESVTFSPDGKYLASASNGFMGFQSLRNLFVREKADYSVRLWDVENQTLLQTFPMPEKKILGLGFSPDGQLVLVFREAGIIDFIDVKTRKTTAKITEHGTIKSFALSPTELLFATVVRKGDEDEIALWRRDSDGFEKYWPSSRSEISSPFSLSRDIISRNIIAISGDGRFVMYRENHRNSYSSKYFFKNIESGDILGKESLYDSIIATAASNATCAFMVSASDYSFYHFALKSDGNGFGREMIKISGWDYDSLVYAPDDTILALGGGYRHSITIWDVSARKIVFQIKQAHQETIKAIRFSPDGSLIATASHDKTIKLWAIG